MAELRDDRGNRVQLTDEFGHPVELTDEIGNPMHITGIVTKEPPAAVETVIEGDVVQETGLLSSSLVGVDGDVLKSSAQPPLGYGGGEGALRMGIGGADVLKRSEQLQPQPSPLGYGEGELRKKELREVIKDEEAVGEIQRSSSSGSSTSEDDGQGGRRKKGLRQKLKEKLNLGGKHKEDYGHATAGTVPPTTAAATTVPGGEPHKEHEKKSVMGKIKDILPGHRSH